MVLLCFPQNLFSNIFSMVAFPTASLVSGKDIWRHYMYILNNEIMQG